MTNYFYLISAEVGNVADNVIVATFSNQVVSMDFSAGIIIRVNGTPVEILSAIRMDGEKIIRYKINVSVASTDNVKLSYTALPATGLDRSSRYGDYTTSDRGTVLLETFINKVVTNNVPSVDPVFVSAEIGNVNAYTVVVTWDRTIISIPSVTIQVNGVTQSISSESSLGSTTSHVIPVLWHGSGDTVTVDGHAVTNNIAWEALLDLQADTGVTESGGAVSAWADQSGNGRNFTQGTVGARPTLQTISGYPAIVFDGSDDWLLGPNFADYLSSFTGIAGGLYNDPANLGGFIVTKIDSTLGVGWWYTMSESSFFDLNAGGAADYIYMILDANIPSVRVVATYEIISHSVFHLYRNGNNSLEQDSSNLPPENFSNSEPVRIGKTGDASGGYYGGDLNFVMIFSPAPGTTDRAALETRLGARYGLTVP